MAVTFGILISLVSREYQKLIITKPRQVFSVDWCWVYGRGLNSLLYLSLRLSYFSLILVLLSVGLGKS